MRTELTLAATAPVAPIDAHGMLILLLQLVLLLGTAFGLGRLCQRFGLPAVCGELAAGVLLGPSILGSTLPAFSGWLFPHDAGQMHLLDAIGQIGVVLLVALTGVHVDTGLAKRQGRAALTISVGGVVLPLGLGVLVGLALPAAMRGAGINTGVFALLIGISIAVSAIPVIAKVLLEMGLMHRNVGQLVMSTATVDDVVGWTLLSVVSGMATAGLTTGRVLWSIGSVVLVLVLTFVVGRPVIKLALRGANRSTEEGTHVAVVVLLVLAFAVGSHALGLEPVVGAFFCGLVISASGLVNRAALVPLRTVVMAVLAPIFFATAGLRMNLTALAQPPVLIAAVALLVVAVIGKFAGAYLGGRMARMGHWESLAVGAGLNARGVIGVIVAMTGLRLGVLTTAGYTIVVLVAVVTSVMAPPLLRATVRRIAETDEEQEREKLLSGRKVAVGGTEK
ncbi:cation:proton antiporter [Labedaea rhizosphaerae]|uniref:Transporter (CPA2 family) n=1 Tax=Labedaea rhizosphaerae TaxID=598644 RepID=A0A4R6S372_LABRH|nr:cation:proton antiporter [Labedaea rhizosphaerae]TDP94041.1 transporter (CPA2 family) [Labedaea rhizosphaerae]